MSSLLTFTWLPMASIIAASRSARVMAPSCCCTICSTCSWVGIAMIST